jgi:lipoyl-dependent peroxiredoxin
MGHRACQWNAGSFAADSAGLLPIVDFAVRRQYISWWCVLGRSNCSLKLQKTSVKETIMAVRKAEAAWNGNLKEGKGNVKFGSFSGPYSFASRFEDGQGTNPEELIAAAHAACFSMAFSHALSEAGHTPQQVQTTAKVHLVKGEGGFSIPHIDLQTEGRVPGIDNKKFQEVAEQAKTNCPVSKVLAGAKITLEATLAS